MAKPISIFLGVFAAGEIPFPFIHTFKDSDGQPISLAGWTADIAYEGPEETGTYGTGAVDIDLTPTTGKVSYDWDPLDFIDVGKYEFVLWVDNGVRRLASDLIKYEVYDAPGDLP